MLMQNLISVIMPAAALCVSLKRSGGTYRRVSGFLSASTTECLWDIEERAAIGQTEANDLLGVWKLASDARGALWADVKFYCAEVLSACDFDHGCTSGATSDSRLSFCAAGYVAWRVCCEGLHC